MLHPDDEQDLCRILRREEVPEDLVAEYDVRIGMYHRAGASGPLGAIGLVDMTRALGYEPKPSPDAPPQTDWRIQPKDGRTRVEVILDGEKRDGAFAGFAPAGMLAVEIDGIGDVRECSRLSVKLVKVLDKTKRVKKKKEEPVAVG